MTEKEIREVLISRPDIRHMILQLNQLSDVKLHAVLVYAEAVQLGADHEEALKEAALYLEESGLHWTAQKILN